MGLKGANSGSNVGVSYADHIANKYKGRGVSAHGSSEANIKGIRNASRGGQRMGSAVVDSQAGARRRTAQPNQRQKNDREDPRPEIEGGRKAEAYIEANI